MNRFSRKYEFDEKTGKEIEKDAPEWTRIAFVDGILADLLFIDLDSRYKNPETKPIGAKTLHKEFALSCRVQLEQDDYDSWICEERLFDHIKGTKWYYFYDLVELIGRKLIENEGEYLFEDDKLYRFGYDTYKKNVNELFKADNIVWQLNDNAELLKSTPEILSKIITDAEKSLIKGLAPARDHYKKAFKYIFTFPTDTENGIKEIVSAVESIGRTIYPKASTLGDVIKHLKKDKSLPEMLIPIIEKFYVFANASPAVRHGSNKHSELEQSDGEFIFYIGVSLIRYLIKKQEE